MRISLSSSLIVTAAILAAVPAFGQGRGAPQVTGPAPKMQDGTFMQAFLDKGRMESILKDMPVQIIANDDCGLIGAARQTLVQKAFKTAIRAAD